MTCISIFRVLSAAPVALAFIAGTASAETLTVHTPTVRVNTGPKIVNQTSTGPGLGANAAKFNGLNPVKGVNPVPGASSGHAGTKDTHDQEQVQFTFQKIQTQWNNGGKMFSDDWSK